MLAAAVSLAPWRALAQVRLGVIMAEFAGPPARHALEQAIVQGADFLVTGVVPSKDGALAALPDNELSALTDVAQRPEFAARRASKAMGGAPFDGWFAEDFTLAELRSLNLGRGQRGGEAPQTVLGLQDVIDIARAGSMRQARVVGVAPRMVRPGDLDAAGLSVEAALADVVRLNGYNSPAAAMIVEAQDAAALQTFGGLSRARRALLIDAPAQLGTQFAGGFSGQSFAAVRADAEGIAPPEALALAMGFKGPPVDSGLTAAAHAAGLAVYVRAAPTAPRARLAALFAAGVDGVTCADPALALKARGDALELMRRRERP